MSSESNDSCQLEIAHVLFTDIVGYSRLPMDQQTSALQHLMRLVRETQEFRNAEASQQLIRLPTGDGMALVFFGDAESAPRCALALSRALRENPDIKLRMGLHTGPVYRVSDINTQKNVAGGGINMAQRVMDCGDAGHILASDAVAGMLGQLSAWADKLHDLGEAEVKHGVRVRVYSLYTAEVGNPELPEKFRRSVQPVPQSSSRSAFSAIQRHRRSALLALAVLVAAAASLYYFTHPVEAINSIAVLPFANASGDEDAEYLSDGITESLINCLSQLSNLKVIARSSVFQYKGKETDPQVVGRELSVRAVLMGRIVQRSGNLKVSAELVDVLDKRRLWGEEYNRNAADILEVQEEIAKDISENLRVKLSGEEQKQLTRRPTGNAEAYDLYLRGRFFWNKRNKEGYRKAIEYFQQAIDKDPNYALAYAGLADSYALLSNYIVFPPKEAMPKAEAAALRALQVDDTLAEAHASLAFVKMSYHWDWLGAEKEFKRAIELNPKYATAHQWYANFLTYTGQHTEAVAEGKEANQLEPLSLIIITNLGSNSFYARQYDQAIEQYRKALEMDLEFVRAHRELAWAYSQKGMYEDAIAEAQKARELSGDGPREIAELGYAYAVAGKKGEARKVLNELSELSKVKFVPSYPKALIYAGLGEKDQAFSLLEEAYKERSQGLVNLKVSPLWDSLRSDSRFADLMRRVGLSP
jgi:adenylate cyclase